MQSSTRQYPRFKAALPIEVCSKSDGVPVRAQTGDICLGGCYVEMTFTKEISTEVELTLWIDGVKVCAQGVVVSSHPSFGNGIKFTHLAAASREQLRLFLASLASSSRLLRQQ